MKKYILAISLALLTLTMISCGSNAAFTEGETDVPVIKVSSASITDDGKLLTVTAADSDANDPRGENQSPQLTWDAVDGAACYAVVMFDEDANWLHFMVPDVEKTSLAQGEYTSADVYVGPYPPKSGGRHNYRIEVFALEQAPDKATWKMDSVNQYNELVAALNRPDGGNILARGHVTGTYAHGDDTV